MLHNDYILTLSCPDHTGIVYRVSGLLFETGCNILDSQQFGDDETGRFFLRMHFDLLTHISEIQLREKFTALGEAHEMDWQLQDARKKARLLIMVSKQGHCLNDLLFRVQSGYLRAETAGIVSNHNDYAELAASYGILFHHLPVSADNRMQQEQQLLDLVRSQQIDLVVLARYMQILSGDMCHALNGRAINIHHSFLPNLKGARLYHQAHTCGVKIIDATAHYVTSDLDEDPIIEQDIERVDHSLTTQDLTRVGNDIESLALSRAIKSHVEHRILLNRNRTVVFR